jgi:integrating conjugative element membrane protein (TIGR03747 family)
MAETKAAAPSNNQEKRVGIFSTILITIFNIVGLLLIGLLISIVVEWLGMSFFWPELGHKHAQAMYNTELQYLQQDFRQSLIAIPPSEIAKEVSELMYRYVIQASGLESLLQRLKWPANDADPLYIRTTRAVHDYLLAMLFVIQTYAVRLSIILLSIPLFILVVTYATVTGLNSRAKRTWGGGRESGTKYHWGKLAMTSLFSLPFIIYLAYPDTIHPTMILIPAATLEGGLVYFVVSNYKKYL